MTGSGRLPAAPEIHETHTGLVALVGDRAYKAKKAVRTDFLDFRDVAAREAACRREIELNSRLSPQAYLGLAHLTDPTGGPAEPVLVMRRYHDDDRLATRARRGEPLRAEIEQIAAVLARFHRDADRSPAIDADGRPDAVSKRWHDNLTELHRLRDAVLPAERIDEITRLVDDYIAGRAGLFAERVAQGNIVDGHADLLADDIFCLPDGPVLLDCLEFDDALRHVDVIDDAAFLAMDLEFLDRADLAEQFLDAYRAASGDTAPASLVHFYVAYRAVVRAKTDCIRAGQGRTASIDDARRHLNLAVDHLRTGAVRLVLVGGGPGTGKTTLARGLAERLGAQVISTDDVRRELMAQGVIGGPAGEFRSGLYSPEQIDAVYAEVVRRAEPLLADGHTVILDGTWQEPRHRAAAREAAERNRCRLVELACSLPLEEAAARIAGRRGSTSDATPQIAAALAAEHDDGVWEGAHRIDTGRTPADSIAEAQQICCLGI